jgi:hypothetical protein
MFGAIIFAAGLFGGAPLGPGIVVPVVEVSDQIVSLSLSQPNLTVNLSNPILSVGLSNPSITVTIV